MTSNENKETPKTPAAQTPATDDNKKKASASTDDKDENKEDDSFLESLDTKFPLSGGETDEDLDL